MKIILSLLAGAAIGVAAHSMTKDNSGNLMQVGLEQESIIAAEEANYHDYQTMVSDTYNPTGFAGDYLAGIHAQTQYEWKTANSYLQKSIDFDKANTDLLKRGIILAIGAGDYDAAAKRAKLLSDSTNDESMSGLFLTVDAIKQGKFDEARTILESLENGGIKDFVRPIMKAWLDASDGKLDTADLRKNSIHFMHGVLIADYLNDKKKTEDLMAEAIALGGVTVGDLKRIAGIYINLGQTDKAQKIYEEILEFAPESDDIESKLSKLNAGEKIEGFDEISSIQDGIALALFDMGKLFYHERAYESAHIFSQMSLLLNSDNVDAHIILADIAAQSDKHDEAIAYYNTIPHEHAYFVKARREIANILEDQDKTDQAIQTLEELAKIENDHRALIQIGDVYRRQENFPKAIEAYNKAEKAIGVDNVIPDYWHLHYVRGMAYEQNGNWEQAEKDLQTALDFKPDHPYLLNYLGYAWADQGMHLDKATDMIEKAVALEPRDGYITDSLGWVLFKRGHYKDAVVHLEKAVELMPYDPVINDHLGDAYWKVGRKLEAKFQWERAKNHIENDDKLMASLEDKLINGMPQENLSIRQAERNMGDDKDKKVLKP